MVHYQNIRSTLKRAIEPLSLNEESRVAICGTGEFAELVYLGLRDIGIEEIEIFDLENSNSRKFLGMLVHDISTLKPAQYDRVVVALLVGADATCKQLQAVGAPSDRLVTFFPEGQGSEAA